MAPNTLRFGDWSVWDADTTIGINNAIKGISPSAEVVPFTNKDEFLERLESHDVVTLPNIIESGVTFLREMVEDGNSHSKAITANSKTGDALEDGSDWWQFLMVTVLLLMITAAWFFIRKKRSRDYDITSVRSDELDVSLCDPYDLPPLPPPPPYPELLPPPPEVLTPPIINPFRTCESRNDLMSEIRRSYIERNR